MIVCKPRGWDGIREKSVKEEVGGTPVFSGQRNEQKVVKGRGLRRSGQGGKWKSRMW